LQIMVPLKGLDLVHGIAKFIDINDADNSTHGHRNSLYCPYSANV